MHVALLLIGLFTNGNHIVNRTIYHMHGTAVYIQDDMITAIFITMNHESNLFPNKIHPLTT